MKFYQGKVSTDKATNESKEINERLSNIEHDIIMNNSMVQESIDRNKKYDDFLDSLMEKAEYEKNFWHEAKVKLTVSSMWSAIVLIAGACVFAAKEYLSH